MKVRNTSTGQSVYLDGFPFDMAEIIIPEINFTYNITNDLASGKSLTAQRASIKETPIIDWNGNYHESTSNRRDGSGTIIVNKNTATAKLFLNLFNEIDSSQSHVHFNIHFWDASNPSVQAMCTYCRFQNMSPVQADNGSANSSMAEQWTFIARTVERSTDKPDLSNNTAGSQDVDSAVETTESQAYQNDLNSERSKPAFHPSEPLQKAMDEDKAVRDQMNMMKHFNANATDNDVDYSNYPVPSIDWDVEQTALWAMFHGYSYNPKDLPPDTNWQIQNYCPVTQTSVKKLLHQSGYMNNGELYGNYPPDDSRSYVPNGTKIKVGTLWNIRSDPNAQYKYQGYGKWQYVGD